jgi:hypothetical protein
MPPASRTALMSDCGVFGQCGQVTVCAEDQQVILLRVARLVVDFLSNEHEHALVPVAVAALEVFDQHVVIGDDDRVQTGSDGCRGNIRVQAGPIRVACVHVQVNSNFLH